MSKLPTVQKPITMAPDLKEFVEDMLSPFVGKDLEGAQQVVRGVYGSMEPATSEGWRDRYTAAFQDAIDTEEIHVDKRLLRDLLKDAESRDEFPAGLALFRA